MLRLLLVVSGDPDIANTTEESENMYDNGTKLKMFENTNIICLKITIKVMTLFSYHSSVESSLSQSLIF